MEPGTGQGLHRPVRGASEVVGCFGSMLEGSANSRCRVCRYGFKDYKRHYVCFDCRKQFKRPTLADVMEHRGRRDVLNELWRTYSSPAEHAAVERRFKTSLVQLRSEYHALISKCPQCGHQMADLGLDFRPPPKANVRAWKSIRAAYRLGHRWHSCGCDGPGFIPATRQELLRYLRERARAFRERISQVERDSSMSTEARVSELALWRDRLARIDRERELERARGR